ncbi:MAG: hypothetical protein ABIR16_07170 [Dokdonella sp.]
MMNTSLDLSTRLSALVLALSACVFANWATAAEGDLDLSFGYYMDGTAYLPIEDRLPGQFSDDNAVAILPQSDGSTIMVGNINRTERHGPPTSFENIGIAKLRPEGTYEYAFGNGGGWLILPGSAVAGNEIHAWSATQDLSGRIAIAGYRTVNGTRSMAIWMVTPTGALDPTFGANGVLTIDRGIPGSSDEARSIIAPTQKDIVATNSTNAFAVAGSFRDSSGALSVGAMVPIAANGALYTGPRGTNSITAGPNANRRYTQMPVPAAYAACNTGTVAQAFRSLNTGIFVWSIVGNVICSDGSRRVMTTRLGTLDQTVAGYGSNGTTTFAFDSAAPARSQALGVDLDSFGRAAIAGSTLQADLVTPANMAAALINVAGVPDGNFNGTGTRVLNWPSGSSSSGTNALVQRNGRILISGSVVVAGEPLMALTRLLPTSATDPAWTIGIGRTYPFVIQSIPSPARTTSSSFAIGESVMLGGRVRDQRPSFTDIDYGAMRMQGDLIYANGWGIDDW